MNLWNYVSKNIYGSPENQIDILISEATRMRRYKAKKIKVLDVGGGLRNRKKDLSKLGSCTTLDIKKNPGVDVVGDAHQLPFSNRSFDVATLFMVLEHLYNPGLAIEECQRVLKPKGLLLLTTVQYWHKHDHPKDYYRFTKDGLLYLCRVAGFKVSKIWSTGGPFLVIFHAIELNLPEFPRKLFLLSAPIFNYFDKLFFKHEDKRKFSDSVGWALIAQKK